MCKENKRFYAFGPFRLDYAQRLLFRQDQLIPLTPKVLQILMVLVENCGRVVSKDELMKAVWPDTFVEEGNLTQNVSMLRKVLAENSGEHTYIQTIPKQGYRFATIDPQETGAEMKEPAPPWFSRHRALMWACVLPVVCAIAVAIGWRFRPTPDVPKSLTVKPLTSYPGLELHPSIAPAGNLVAFAWDGERQDNLDIYVKVIGSDRSLRLTDNPDYDFRPAWSPDGAWLAFLRGAPGQKKLSIVRIPSTGGPERSVADVDPGLLASYRQAPFLEWTPDGKWLLTADRVPAENASSLFLISVESGQKRRLTFPRASFGDVSAAISPDGRTLAFSRNELAAVGRFCTLPLSGDFTGTEEPGCFAISDSALANPGGIRWTPDRQILFSPLFKWSPRTGLWLMSIPPRRGDAAVPQQFPIPSGNASDPAISRDGQRLVYTDSLVDADIWRVDLRNTGARPVKLITSTKFDHEAQYSPDGKKIVFVSRRSGHPELWTADSDGSNSTQLTTLEAPLVGMPHWSPDGQRIVFHSTLEKQFELYLVNADGSGLRRLTDHPGGDAVGSWSHDGRWIYFVSTRSGEHQIWKLRADGGQPVQITRQGGEGQSLESPDGKFVYYAKSIGSPGGAATLWRTPVNGGEEVKILDSLFHLQWTLTASGIYFAAPSDSGPSIRFFSFRTRQITTIAPRELGGRAGISVSPDGRFLLYSIARIIGSDLMLVENFR